MHILPYAATSTRQGGTDSGRRGGNGVVLGLERVVDEERVCDEYQPRRCRQAARALVEVLEVGGFEAKVGPDRGRDALSNAWNRDFGGIHNGHIHDRVSWTGPCSQRQALGGIHHVQGDDDHRGCGDVPVVARAASLGTWSALSRTRTPRRSLRGGSRPVGLRGGHFRTIGGVAAVAARFRIGRRRDTIRHGAATAGRPGGGQAISDELENSRIRPMLVARSALSGIAGN